MKRTMLVVSIILTGIAFSMSFVSGENSGSLSSGVTEIFYRFLSNIFPNHVFDLDSLHIFVRKSAHIFEYSLMGISWFYTMKLWGWSFSTLLFIGLLIASTDETIQIFAEDRGPSVLDALVFDYLPFAFFSTILWFIYNSKGEKTMTTETLAQLQQNVISPEVAYEELFKTEKKRRIPFFKRAHFIKLKIHIPDQKGVNVFLKVLFFIPLPLFILRILLAFVKMDRFDENIPLTKREMFNLIAHRGVRVQVNTHSGEKILIKTL